jgi:histidinol phosphatase-like PHP family hydrolase
MNKKIKLDLHTHPVMALKESMGIEGIRDIKKEVADSIVKAVKNAGLNGIAITEHNNFNHGWVSALEIMDRFQGENLIILPGSEIDYAGQHYLQIYIPDRYRRRIPFFKGKEWFLILAHPGYYHPIDISQIGNIDFDAVEETSLLGEFAQAGSISKEKGISVVRSSDARRLEDIGTFSIEVEVA